MKPLLLFFFIVVCLSSFGQEKPMIVKFTGDDIEFDELKIFKLIEARQPEMLQCGGVIYTTDIDDEKEIEKSDTTKESQIGIAPPSN